MRVGILTTNGGPHPAWKWAEQTASQISDIIQIEPSSIAYNELSAQKVDFEKEVSAVLISHHETVQNHEKKAIEVHGTERLLHPITPEDEHIDAATNAVVTVAKTKMFGSHFYKPEVVDFIRNTIGSHFATAQHIERSWHADRTPDHEHSKAFRLQYHPGLEK